MKSNGANENRDTIVDLLALVAAQDRRRLELEGHLAQALDHVPAVLKRNIERTLDDEFVHGLTIETKGNFVDKVI